VLLAAWSIAASLGAQQPELPAAPGKLVDVGGRRLQPAAVIQAVTDVLTAIRDKAPLPKRE